MAALILAIAPAGCGESKDDRQRRAFDRYKRQVESACHATVAKIAQRGAPADLRDLDRLAGPALIDAQDLVRTIRDLRVPKGSERRVEPLLYDLGRAGERLRGMEAAISGATTLEQLSNATSVSGALVDVDFSGRTAGIRCIGPPEIKVLGDAAQGPIYVERFVRFQRVVRRKLDGVSLTPADTTIASVQPLYERIQDIRGRYDLLDVPSYAAKPSEAYSDLIFDLEQVYYGVIYNREQGDAPSLPKVQRRIARLVRREPLVLQRLIRALREGLPKPDDRTPGGATPA